MGWLSSYRWYSPTVLRKEYEEDIARSGKIKTFGWCGSFLKCLHVPTNRPFVIDVMVRFFGKNEGYGYKDIESTSGPYDTNIAAARWLRRELAKRNLDPVDFENNWLLYCTRKARHNQMLKKLTQGTKLTALRDFTITCGYKFHAGETVVVNCVSRGRIICTPHLSHWPTMSLSSDIFIPSPYRDYPLMVV